MRDPLIAFAIIIAAGLIAWSNRYVVHEGKANPYFMDNFTGNVIFCHPAGCRPLPFTD